MVTRAKIILLADEGLGIRETARKLDVSRDQVQRWHRRWLSADCLVDASKVLADAPREGAPATYSPEQICALVAMACEQPEDSDHPISHWTQPEIADEAIKRGIVDNISPRSVGRFCHYADLQPHRVRYWLTPKPSVPFEEKCADICETYQKAPFREKCGEKTISIDEMTGVQALERAAPFLPMKSGQPERQEFEYIRHGTQTLIAGFDVAFVQVFGEIGETRTEDDFARFISNLFNNQVNYNKFHIVTDNLNIHVSESIVRIVAEKCEINEDLGIKGKSGILKSMETREELAAIPQAQNCFS